MGAVFTSAETLYAFWRSHVPPGGCYEQHHPDSIETYIHTSLFDSKRRSKEQAKAVRVRQGQSTRNDVRPPQLSKLLPLRDQQPA